MISLSTLDANRACDVVAGPRVQRARLRRYWVCSTSVWQASAPAEGTTGGVSSRPIPATTATVAPTASPLVLATTAALLARACELELLGSDSYPRPASSTVKTVATRFDEALAMIADGDHRAAVERLGGILDEVMGEYGPRSEMAARVHVALAAAYDYLDEIDHVRRHAELADQISLEAVGPAHPIRTDVLSAVGVVATHDGRTDDAVLAFEWALRIVRRLKPPMSIEVALAEHNLASALIDASRLERAEQLLEHAIPVLEQELGQDDALLADARQLLTTSRVNPSR